MKRYAIMAVAVATATVGLVLWQSATPRSSRARAATSPGITIAAGTLRDDSGAPVSNGLVRVYPTTTGSDWSGTSAPVATTVAANDGRFALTLPDSGLAALQRDAAGNGGVVNLDAVADNGGDMAGVAGFSIDIGRLGSPAKLQSAPQQITVKMQASAVGATSGKRARRWHCPTPGTIKKKVIRRFKRWDQVGEANNAYRDSNASFSYGRSADTEATKGVSVHGSFFSIAGTTHVGNSHSAAVGASTAGRGQIRVYTRFKYLEGRSRWCDYRTHKHYQRFGLAPVRWIKRVRHKHQDHTLHRCPRKPILRFPKHTHFSRTHHRFKRYSQGFSIGPSFHGWGIKFHGSGTSGASEFARLHESFGGRTRHHYVCGRHGKSAFRGHRVFSGARRHR